jgi:hypothetical protein
MDACLSTDVQARELSHRGRDYVPTTPSTAGWRSGRASSGKILNSPRTPELGGGTKPTLVHRSALCGARVGSYSATGIDRGGGTKGEDRPGCRRHALLV